MGDRPLRIAIVGAGPAGLYAAGHLLAGHGGTYLAGEIVDLHDLRIEVDVLDRLPTPWGLVRAGVAPDHPEKKLISNVFDAIADRPGFRFFGNVELGKDLSHAELETWYDAVIYATGAAGDAHLDLPGSDLPGCHPAREFVAWYNGHPDHADQRYDFSTERAVIVGNGNVALDIARILCLPQRELQRTDMADHAIEALAASTIREIVILGRRGAQHAAFNNPELDELTRLPGTELVVEGDLGEVGDPHDHDLMRKLATLRRFTSRTSETAGKRVVLQFLSSPVELQGHRRVESIVIARNEIVVGDNGIPQARATNEHTTLATGLVLPAVGYRGTPIAGLPSDEAKGTLANAGGRVEGHPAIYVTGWLKRGPSGIIGTNKKCARDTVRALLRDHAAGILGREGTLGSGEVLAELLQRQPHLVSQHQWKLIDRHERRQGADQGRPRAKVTSRTQLLELAGVTP